ncbi:Cyclomaltodextrinase [Ostertagia ostertagi]
MAKKVAGKKLSDEEQVNQYMEQLDHPLKEGVALLRHIIKATSSDLQERVKWNAPSYYCIADIVTFGPLRGEKILLVFHHPHIVKVKSPLLEGKYPDRRLAYFDSLASIKANKHELQRHADPFTVYQQPVSEYCAGLFGEFNLVTKETHPAFREWIEKHNNAQHLVIRPENFYLTNESDGMISGTVQRILFWGNYFTLDVQVGLQLLRISTRAIQHAVGDTDLRIEPMNWWVGMKTTTLQLMVHGENIGDTKPTTRYPGVTIKQFQKGDSPNYLFIDLIIAPTTKPGKLSILFTKDGKSIATQPYELKAREKNASQVKGFSSSDVIYLVTPDRFANGDTTNDVVNGMRETKLNRKNDYGRHGGDIRGMINHLDYIADMGFTAIWPMPLLENDMANASYHGYAITDYYKVDPRYGTLDEYRELADKARQKGLKLVFDAVAAGTADDQDPGILPRNYK